MKSRELHNRSLQWWMPWARRVVSLLVILAVSWTAWKGLQQLDQQSFDWRQINPWWGIGAAVAYFMAMASGWIYWHCVLRFMNQHPSPSKSFRAFFYSQLAKYIPGKAMVVVVRSSSVAGPNVKPSVAVVSVFVETLTWISVAATIALFMLIVNPALAEMLRIAQDSFSSWAALALSMMAVTVVPTLPPVSRRIVSLFASKKLGWIDEDARHGLNLRSWMTGWLILPIGWCFNAVSLWLILNAIPGTGTTPGDLFLCLAVVSLATVIGFLSFIPGGIGVRELVMIPLLGSSIGATPAIVAAIALRLVWLATELAIALGVYLMQRLIDDDSRSSGESADSRKAA